MYFVSFTLSQREPQLFNWHVVLAWLQQYSVIRADSDSGRDYRQTVAPDGQIGVESQTQDWHIYEANLLHKNKWSGLQSHSTAHWSYCPGVLGIANMDTRRLGFSLMGISQPGCSTISTAYRGWFIAGNINIEDVHSLIKTLKKTWVKKKLHIFYTI